MADKPELQPLASSAAPFCGSNLSKRELLLAEVHSLGLVPFAPLSHVHWRRLVETDLLQEHLSWELESPP